MNFPDWIAQTKADKPDLSEFITKLDPFFTDTGFNGLEFEKKVATGLRKIDTDIINSLKPQTNATS